MDPIWIKCKALKHQFANLNGSTEVMSGVNHRVRLIEYWNRRKNLRPQGVNEAHNEIKEPTTHQVQKFVADKLGVLLVRYKTPFTINSPNDRNEQRHSMAKLSSEVKNLETLKSISILNKTIFSLMMM